MKGFPRTNILVRLHVLCALVLICLFACTQPAVPINPFPKDQATGVGSMQGQSLLFASKSPAIPETLHPGRNGTLSDKEIDLARIAWRYFENNYQPKTGFVNAAENYPSTTMWDTSSYLGGLVAAFELNLITREEFDRRLTLLLDTFKGLPFFRDELPNKAYNTKTGEKVNYNNQPGEIGFSAIDLGRLLIWLKIIKERYPEYSGSIEAFVSRWKFSNVLDRFGTMYGATLDGSGQVRYIQEGRLGYEEYAAKGFQLWGFDTTRASMVDPYGFVKIYGVDIPYDLRDPREMGAHNYVVTESYVLDGMELGWDLPKDTSSDDLTHTDSMMADFAGRVYQVQAERFRRTGILTARTEHQLDGPPFFVYDTIYSDGFPWNTITEDGKYVPEFAALSLKAAFGLWVLWETPYTDSLWQTASNLYDPEKGFYEGRYEKDGRLIKTFTANNNGIILESLLYKVQGKLLKFAKKSAS